MANKDAKLGDFGCAKSWMDSSKNEILPQSSCFAKLFAAPEIISGNPYSLKYVDGWSLGVVFFFMCNNYLPFTEVTNKKLLKLQLERQYREFIEAGLVDFSETNPSTVIYLKPRRHRSPSIVAEYLNGQNDYINCNNFTKDEVNKWINVLVSQSGKEVMRYRKLWHTDTPSIQGVWSPFTFRPTKYNKATFNQELIKNKFQSSSATNDLVQLFQKKKI